MATSVGGAAGETLPWTIAMHYQPIMSLRQKSVVGLEALARARSPLGESWGPGQLFAAARAASLAEATEAACRRQAMAGFRALGPPHADRSLLFLNLDIAVSGVDGVTEELTGMAADAGIAPRRIVLEIVESKFAEAAHLAAFVERQKAAGFLIALDDVGAGHSNLRRIALVKPDLLKIDRSLVQGIDEDYHRQEVVRSLVQLGRRIGALIVAEGIERFEEAVTVSILGVDYLQGYHLAHPQPVPSPVIAADLEAVGAAYAERSAENAVAERARFQQGKALVQCLQEACAVARPARFDEVLAAHVNRGDLIDVAYILDARGVQLSRTVCRIDRGDRDHPLFAPAEAGTDHSLKDYFVRAAHGGGLQVTEPYISLATGRLCITMALGFRNAADEATYILCVDQLWP